MIHFDIKKSTENSNFYTTTAAICYLPTIKKNAIEIYHIVKYFCIIQLRKRETDISII